MQFPELTGLWVNNRPLDKEVVWLSRKRRTTHSVPKSPVVVT